MEKLQYSSYLICHDQVKEVKNFLMDFFEETVGEYNHENWVTLKIPNSDFSINLMKGSNQAMTQNMVFEIYCDSMEQLQEFAKKYNTDIKSFLVTEVKNTYTYNYLQISGPKDICKIEFSYIKK